MSEQQDSNRIQIDSDWKAQAQAEKQKLSEKSQLQREKPGSTSRTGGAGQLPPANFNTLVSTLATQALLAMGAIPDPRTGQRTAILDLARHHIDMLTVIEEKTKGNLTEEEAGSLAGTLYELRSHYVNVANAAMKQQ